MRVPLPERNCRQISDRAAQHAREDIIGRGWSSRSVNAIVPLPGREGMAGVVTTAKYLLYQDRGIQPFVMYWVEGRKVPIHDKGSGKTHVVTGREPGKPGWVTLPGGVRKWRDQKWRHPGLEPKNFMGDALNKAIQDEGPNIRTVLLEVVRGQYHE